MPDDISLTDAAVILFFVCSLTFYQDPDETYNLGQYLTI